MIGLTSRPYLFVDETLIERHDNTSLRLHSPERKDIPLVTDAPWEGPDSAYYVVVDAGDVIGETQRYRIYYRGMAGGSDWDRTASCVIESEDGIHWNRRLTWKYPKAGTLANNIVWDDQRNIGHNFCPFLDKNPDAPAETKFKGVGGLSKYGLYLLGSPDGINWRLLQDTPIVRGMGVDWKDMDAAHPRERGLALDSLNVAYWDTEMECYILYVRDWKGARTVMTMTSPDMIHWSDPEWMDFGEGELEHFYTSAIQQYDRDPGLRLGFPKRFMPDRTRYPECGEAGVSDCVLISSRDGIRFPRRFREAFIRPGLDQANWTHRNIMMAPGMIRTSTTEYSLYWSEHYGHHDNRLVRGTIRVDGFASLHADTPGGEAVTVPVRLDGNRLAANLSTSAVGGLRVEVQDERGKPIPGYGLEDSDELFGDDIERTVKWKKSPDISRLRGKTVRMRIVLADADLYSLACH